MSNKSLYEIFKKNWLKNFGEPFPEPKEYKLLPYPAPYELVTKRGQPGIKCNTCNLTSYNPNDVKQKYCAKCKVFHDDRMQYQCFSRHKK